MADPIEAHYTPDGDDWAVAVMGRGRTLTGRAPGLIAARDKADQLVEQITPDEPGHTTVVHLLNGDAVEFTTAYLTARLARTEEPAVAAADEQTPQTAEEPAGDRPTEATATPDNAAGGDASPGGAEPAIGASPTEAEPVADAPDSTAADSPIGAALGGEEAARDVPAPAAPVEGGRPAVAKPTPAPRTESQAAHPAAQPAETPVEETAPSGS